MNEAAQSWLPAGTDALEDTRRVREALVEERRRWLQRLSGAPDDLYLRRRFAETQRLIDIMDRVIADEQATADPADQ
jgi:hypothetical protein